MQNAILERLLRLAFVRRRVVLVAALCLLVVSAALTLRVSFDTNIVRLLPRKGPVVNSFDLYLSNFGTFDRIYVLFEVPEGHRISQVEDFVDRYVEQLRKAPEIESVDAELFDDVKDWNYLFDRQLLLLGPDNVPAALSRFEPDRMAEELAKSRALLAVSSPDVKAYVQRDPLSLLPLLRDRLGRGRALVDFDPTQKGYVSRDGRARLVMAKPVKPPFDTRFCKQLFARLSGVEAAARAAASEESGDEPAPTPVTVEVAGGYRIALEAERVIRREMVFNTIGSLVGLLLLVFAVFRTFRVLIYGSVPLVLAGLFTFGVNGLAGPLSPVASGSAAMLFGLGIDGVALLYIRYVEERNSGHGPLEAIREERRNRPERDARLRHDRGDVLRTRGGRLPQPSRTRLHRRDRHPRLLRAADRAGAGAGRHHVAEAGAPGDHRLARPFRGAPGPRHPRVRRDPDGGTRRIGLSHPREHEHREAAGAHRWNAARTAGGRPLLAAARRRARASAPDRRCTRCWRRPTGCRQGWNASCRRWWSAGRTSCCLRHPNRTPSARS